MSQQIPESLPDTVTPASHIVFEDYSEIWGRLTPKRPYMPVVGEFHLFITQIRSADIQQVILTELCRDVYTLGRKDTCNIFISCRNINPPLLGLISKEHFKISRDDTYVPYIEDLSKNGTYLNGGLIGKGHMSTLCTGDVIAIGSAKVEGELLTLLTTY